MAAELSILSPQWDVPNSVVAAVTTRAGGVSESPYASLNIANHVGDEPNNILQNRQLLSEKFGVNLRWQWLQQIHGVESVRVSEAKESIEADGLFTQASDLVCCVMTADCLPIFFAAKNGCEVAVAHAGWRGLAGGIVENTVSQFSVPTIDISAWLGPAIGPCHFEVGSEVRDVFLSQVSNPNNKLLLEQCFSPVENSPKLMADLVAVARLKLAALGITDVSGGDYCTYCNEEDFFSYRRDGVTGRLLSMIYIDGEDRG